MFDSRNCQFVTTLAKKEKRILRREETISLYFVKKLICFVHSAQHTAAFQVTTVLTTLGRQKNFDCRKFSLTLVLHFSKHLQFSEHSIYIRFSFHCKQLFSILKAKHCFKVIKAKWIFESILPEEHVPQECP